MQENAPEDAGVTPTYDQLFKSLKATHFSSRNEVSANAAALDGRVIELMGDVLGTTASTTSRTLLLHVDNEAAVLTSAPDMKSDVTLQPGASVRVLVKVGSAGAGDSDLTLIAARAVYSGTAMVTSQSATLGTGSSDDNAVLVAPPMTTLIIPDAAPQGSTPRSPRAASGNASTAISLDASKPAYKALVRRFNSRLREDQVDEIATALLSAGYTLNMDPRFLAAMVAVESGFNPNSQSRSGALGLGQLMPFNWKTYGISDPYNPTQSIMGMARMLRGHLDEFSNRPNSTLLAVAAYNAGAGAVRRAGYQVPPTSQVQRYVWKVYYKYKDIAPDMFR
jgi:hypothetical protein